MHNEVKVSIILPTYNGGIHIKKAIESVLAQSFSTWELIIIDDGSSDNTESVIREYVSKDSRIIFIKNKSNLGIQKSLNKGLSESKGEYVARIDSDDEWIYREKLQKQIEFLDNNQDCVLVGTGAVVVDVTGKEVFRYLLPETDQEIRNKILRKNCFVHSSVVFRKNAALNFFGYSDSKEIKHIEDYDLWLKLGTVGKFSNLPIYSISLMARNESISSHNKLEQFRKDVFLIKKYKNEYPEYIKSIIFGYLRLYFFWILNFIPIFSRNWIIKTYKEF